MPLSLVSFTVSIKWNRNLLGSVEDIKHLSSISWFTDTATNDDIKACDNIYHKYEVISNTLTGEPLSWFPLLILPMVKEGCK